MGFLLFLVFYEEKISMGVGGFQILAILVWLRGFLVRSCRVNGK